MNPITQAALLAIVALTPSLAQPPQGDEFRESRLRELERQLRTELASTTDAISVTSDHCSTVVGLLNELAGGDFDASPIELVQANMSLRRRLRSKLLELQDSGEALALQLSGKLLIVEQNLQDEIRLRLAASQDTRETIKLDSYANSQASVVEDTEAQLEMLDRHLDAIGTLVATTDANLTDLDLIERAIGDERQVNNSLRELNASLAGAIEMTMGL